MYLKIHTPPVVHFYKIFHKGCMEQWRNRRGGECPQRLVTGKISADLSGKKRQGKIGNREERRKIVKGKVENWKWKEGKVHFSLFKTMKICFKCTKMEIFSWEKGFHGEKKSGKKTLPPQKKFPVTPLVWSSPILLWIQYSNPHNIP